MQQSPSWEANRFAASQEIPHILWNPKVHYRIHKCPPPVLIPRQIDPVHTPTSNFLNIHLNIITPSMPGYPPWSLFPRFLHQNPVKNIKWSRYRPGAAQRVGRGIALLFHDRGTRRGWVVSRTSRPHFTPGKSRHPFYRRLGGPQVRSGQVRKISPSRGLDPSTVQPVVSRYTDWATRPTSKPCTQRKYVLNTAWF